MDGEERIITLEDVKSQIHILIDGRRELPMFYCGNCGTGVTNIVYLDYPHSDYFQIVCDNCLHTVVEATVDETITKFEKPVDK